MRVPFKHHKNRSAPQLEIVQDLNLPVTQPPSHDQPSTSRRRKLVKHQHGVKDEQHGEKATHHKLVKRAAAQLLKSTQTKKNQKPKTAPSSRRNSQYSAVLDVSDSEVEPDISGKGLRRPARDSVLSDQMSSAIERDLNSKEPEVAIAMVNSDEDHRSTAPEPDTTIDGAMDLPTPDDEVACSETASLTAAITQPDLDADNKMTQETLLYIMQI